MLFVLSIEPLANLIRSHPEYRGIALPNNTSIRVGMFADDTCFYAKDEASVQIIKEMTDIYANGSGGKANLDKTEILPIGEIGGKVFAESIADIKVINPSNPVRLLGIMVGNNVDPREVWTPILGRVDKLLNETWKDRHISYRGKLVVIKHLALPIIMFTAPFIHMPKDMSDKLDKTLRKFIFSGKKCKVALDTLKLPIEYGGMSVPNIKYLTDAARIRWIKKLVDDQTPVIWRELAVHMLDRACDTTIGTNIFRHPEMKVVHTRNPHLQHWLWALKAWRRLEGQGSTTPSSLDEFRSMHLTEFNLKVGKLLARHGYNTVNDILAPDASLTEPKYISRTQLVKNPKHNLASASTYQGLVDLLPKETTIPSNFMSPDDPCTVYRVIEGAPETATESQTRKRTRRYSKGKTHIPHKPCPKTKVQKLQVLEDRFVIPSGKPNLSVDLSKLHQVDIRDGRLQGRTAARGNATMDKLQLKLDGEMQPLEKYSRMAAYRTFQHSNTRKHKHHDKWNILFEGENISWPTLTTHPTNSTNLMNIRFLLMHGAIRIGSQARHWLKNTDLTCPSCRQKCDDIHLFLECETTIQAWKHVEDFWTSLQSKHPILENYQVKQSYKLFGPPMITTKNSIDHNIYSFLDILLGHMQTIIWNTYCSKIHSNVDYDTSTIIKTFDNNIKKSLHVFLFAMKQPAYTPSRWACPKLPQEKISHNSSRQPMEKDLRINDSTRDTQRGTKHKQRKRQTSDPTRARKWQTKNGEKDSRHDTNSDQSSRRRRKEWKRHITQAQKGEATKPGETRQQQAKTATRGQRTRQKGEPRPKRQSTERGTQRHGQAQQVNNDEVDAADPPMMH